MASKLGHLERGPSPREGGVSAWAKWGNHLPLVGNQLGKAECPRRFWQPGQQAPCAFRHPSWTQTFMAGEVVLSTCRSGPPATLPHQPKWVLLPVPPMLLNPNHGHRSASTCSAGKTFPAHEAELAPRGQLNKAPRGGRPCSALCCFSFSFSQINRLPQRETNIFVSKPGRAVRMACLPASR